MPICEAAAQTDIEELWRRVAYSILITNVDDHLHNHGFLHAERGLWRLAPAFDLNPFPDRVRELKTWVSADVGPEATIEALMSVTAYFRISASREPEAMLRIIGQVGAKGFRDSDLCAFQFSALTEKMRLPKVLLNAATILLIAACAHQPDQPEVIDVNGLIPITDTLTPNARAYKAPAFDRSKYQGIYVAHYK